MVIYLKINLKYFIIHIIEFTFSRGCYIFLKMIKVINRKIMFLYYNIAHLKNHFLVKFEKFCLSFILNEKITASVLKLVNRQDLKSCGW